MCLDGINGFADALVQELLEEGVLINTIFSGGINTPLWNSAENPYSGDKSKIMHPAEIVDFIESLLSQPKNPLHKKIVVFPTNERH